ncbi:hypothetical protein GCM10009857_08470 [Agromyces soli]
MAQSGGRGWFRRRTHADDVHDAGLDPAQSTGDQAVSPPAGLDTGGAPTPTAGDVAEQRPSPPSATPSAMHPGDDALRPAKDIPSTTTPPRPARVDWDAATAAALADDTAISPDAHQAAPSADPLLEEIIREIVGDAAVDTVESLQPRTAEFSAESPTAGSRTEGVGRSNGTDASAARVNQAQGEDLPTNSAPPAAGSASLAAAPPVADESPASPEDSGQVDTLGGVDSDGSAPHSPSTNTEQLRLAISGALDRSLGPAPVPDTSATATPSAPAEPDGTAEAERRAASAVQESPVGPESAGKPAADLITTPDVSRETSIISGGTPLADALADETRRRIALEEAVLPLPPTTRVLTISNQKGGVGKTTTAVNLAAALARSGAKVLVIDLDPQGNASTALGVDHRSEERSVYEVLVSDLALSEVIRPSTEHEMLDCVPATIHLAGAEIELVSLVAREQRLRRALDTHLSSMERPYDYVFIDCPPSLGLLTINAFVAAREVLIPIQCEYYALEGLSQLLSNIELIEKHLNPELRLSTILLTMYDSRTNLAQQVAQEVRNHFPTQTLQTIIPRSVRVSEAPSYGQSVISYDFGSTGSLSYREAAAEIAKRGAAKAGAPSKEQH